VQVISNNLASGTTYRYCVVATNLLGTAAGGDATFTTVAELPLVALGMPSLVTDSSATLTGSVNPANRATTYTFQYARRPATDSRRHRLRSDPALRPSR